MEIKVCIADLNDKSIVLELPDGLSIGEIEEACTEWVVEQLDWYWEKVD